MKIALPIANGKLCMHFGHCEVFAFFTVDQNEKKILTRSDLVPPPHEPGVLPRWIKEQGATVVLAGGMGKRAQELFTQNGVMVYTGVVETNPDRLIHSFLNDDMKTGQNCCDH